MNETNEDEESKDLEIIHDPTDFYYWDEAVDNWNKEEKKIYKFSIIK